jgi:hypothetical protein
MKGRTMRKILAYRPTRRTVFVAGVTVGAGVTYIVLRNRIILDTANITLSAPDTVLSWLAETGHQAEFMSDVGTFVLVPPK